ncbi:transglutaminase family protein [Streptomyces smaragdinus]|uniref:transglutaminase family protein n=1 Tax=Streptomyces smaragdinus TaxID=2585196 RepID=UPI0012952A70
MSGRGRLAFAAWTATLLTTTALLPLTDGAGWYFQAVFVVSVVTGTGVVGRRIPLARPATVALQVLVSVMLLTLMFAASQAFAGLIPGPEAIRHFADLYESGGQDVRDYAIPAPVGDGIRLLLLTGVTAVAILVDALAATYRSAAPAGLPLLALYSVASGINDDNGWLLFLLAACGYLTLLLAEGRERLSQWGRVFGGLGTRPPGRPGTDSGTRPVTPMRTGRRIGAMALGLALIAPAVLPSLSGGLLEGAGTGTGKGNGDGGLVNAVNPVVQLQESLNQPDDREVLTYRASDKKDHNLYLRFIALDRFDGVMWTASRRDIRPVPDRLPQPQGMTLGDLQVDAVDLQVQAQKWYQQQWLPMPYPAASVDVGDDWRFEPEGRTVVGTDGQDTGGERYRLTTLEVQPTAGQLAAAGPPPVELSREYTRLPPRFPAEVRQKAVEVTKGATNKYEQAVALQRYFQGSFTYETSVDLDRNDPQAIVKFLKDRKGFCVHFSFAMASMARSLGIPARIAVGFTPGKDQGDGVMSVGLKDAHAWPELYFEGVGWTRFEPTPTRGSVPSYSLGESSSTTPRNKGQDPSAAPTDTAPAAPLPSTSGCPASLRNIDPAGCSSQAPAGALDTGGDDGFFSGPVVAGLVLVALVLLLLAAPALWRRRARRARLARGAPALAAWAELGDSAWDFGVPPDDALTPRQAVVRLIRLGSLDAEASAAAHRVATAVERVLYAPAAEPAAGVAGDVRRVVAGLGAAAPRRVRLRARLAPRSAAQVAWAWSQAWSERTQRWSEAVRAAGMRLRPRREGAS